MRAERSRTQSKKSEDFDELEMVFAVDNGTVISARAATPSWCRTYTVMFQLSTHETYISDLDRVMTANLQQTLEYRRVYSG